MGGDILLDGQVTDEPGNQRMGFSLCRGAHFFNSFQSETLIKSIIYNTISRFSKARNGKHRKREQIERGPVVKGGAFTRLSKGAIKKNLLPLKNSNLNNG